MNRDMTKGLKLTDEEFGMLSGAMGPFMQKAMEFNVRYAIVLGAREMCEVSRATLFLGAQHCLDCYPPDEDYRKIFSEFYLCSDETVDLAQIAVSCKAQTCEGSCDFHEYERTHLTREYHERNLAYLSATRDVGIPIVDTCTPYFVGWIPVMGEHFVSTESSNVVMSNSLFGAMGNSDGVEAAVCAAVTGRTPLWGMHIAENRFADCVVHLECRAEDAFDWDLIGFTIGRMMPKHSIPVIVGDFKRPDINMLRQAFSTISVTSAVEICHIAGITPEARTQEAATCGKKIRQNIVVTQRDCDESCRMICEPGEGPVDYVSIGCPHLALDELKDIAAYLSGKRLASGVELLVWTSYPTKEMANVNGYTQAIEASGAYLLTGSCPVVMREMSHKHAGAMVMNGAKQAYNMKNQTSVPVYFGDMWRCIDAAINGRWSGVI
jgi:predicted aconitase